MSQFKPVIIFMLGGFFAVFVLQNTDVVSVRFLIWEISMSRIIFLPLVFITGAVVGYILKWKHR